MSSAGQPSQKKGTYNRMGMLKLSGQVVAVNSPKPAVVSVQQKRHTPPSSSVSMEWEESKSQAQSVTETTRFPSRNSSRNSDKDAEEEKVALTPEPITSSSQVPELFQQIQQLYSQSTTPDEQAVAETFTTAPGSTEGSVEEKEETMVVNEEAIEEDALNQAQTVQEPTVDSTQTEDPRAFKVDSIKAGTPTGASNESAKNNELEGLHEKRDFLVGPYSGMLQLPRALVLGMAIEEIIRVFGKEFHDWLTEERAIKLMNSTSWSDSETEPSSTATSGQVFRGWLDQRAEENKKTHNINVDEPTSFQSSTNVSELDMTMVQDACACSHSSSLGSAGDMVNGKGPVMPIPFRLSPELYSEQFLIDGQGYMNPPPPNSIVSPRDQQFVALFPQHQATDVVKRAVSSMSRNSERSSRESRPLSSLSIKSDVDKRKGKGKGKAKQTVAQAPPSKNLERARSVKDLLLGDLKPKLPNVRVVRGSPTSQSSLSDHAGGIRKSLESITLNPEVSEFVPGRLAMNLPSAEPSVSSLKVIPSLLLDIPTAVAHMEAPISSHNQKFELTEQILDQYVPRPVSFHDSPLYKLRQMRFRDCVTRMKKSPEETLAYLGPASYPEFS